MVSAGFFELLFLLMHITNRSFLTDTVVFVTFRAV